MDRDKLIEMLGQKDVDDLLIVEGTDTIDSVQINYEALADHLIENGIGDITAEKHRADVAEEALKNLLTKYEESNRELLSHYNSFSDEPVNVSVQNKMQKELQQAAKRLKEKTK